MGNSKRAKKRSHIVKIIRGEELQKVVVFLTFEQRGRLESLQKELQLSKNEIMIEALTSYLDLKQIQSLWGNNGDNE